MVIGLTIDIRAVKPVFILGFTSLGYFLMDSF